MKEKTNSEMIRGVIILIFANTCAAGAEWATAALKNISLSFPDAPYSTISMILNIPNLCAAILSIVSGMIINRKIALKPLLLIAISLHCVGGIIPAIWEANSINVVLFGRLIFGIGYGLMQGIGISMSFQVIKDEKLRANAMGWAVASQYAMNLIAQLVVGYLSDIKWYYAFYVYLWGIIPFFVILFICPSIKQNHNNNNGDFNGIASDESVLETVRKMPGTVWVFSAFTAIYMFSYYPFFLTMSKIITERGFGTGTKSGIAMTYYAVATVFGGMIYGRLQRKLKHLTLCVCLIGVAVSMAGLFFSTSFTMICMFNVLSGITSTGVIPGCVNEIYKSVPLNRSFLGAGLAAAGVNGGAFLTTPYLMIFEAFNVNTIDSLYVSAIIMAVFGFITITFCKISEQHKENRLAENDVNNHN